MAPETPILLILDLDETLIHAAEESLGHEHDFLVGPYRVYRRPHLAEFLTSCSAAFRLAVWPSASDDHVREVVGRIIPPGVDLAFAWGRSRCVRRYDPELFEEHPFKDLKKVKRLGYPLDRILIAENTPRKVVRNYQRIVTGLGHESPTFVLTNDLPKLRTAREVIQAYASRNHMKKHLCEQITLIRLDCLCSDVRLNVDFSLSLTVLADLLYRSLGERLKGFARAWPARLFRKFFDSPGEIEVRAEGVVVCLSKRAHNPLLKEAGLTKPTRRVPWLGNRSVHVICP